MLTAYAYAAFGGHKACRLLCSLVAGALFCSKAPPAGSQPGSAIPKRRRGRVSDHAWTSMDVVDGHACGFCLLRYRWRSVGWRVGAVILLVGLLANSCAELSPFARGILWPFWLPHGLGSRVAFTVLFALEVELGF